MVGQPGFFDQDERLRALSAAGDPLERLAAAVDFELFRPELDAALSRSDRSRGGRPPYDAVLMLRVLVLQTLYTLSDDQTEYQLRDRLSFMRFAGLGLHEPVPDAKTIWLFREQLTKAGAIDRLFRRLDAALRDKGVLAMGGQIVDATIVQARPARLTAEEKAVVRRGKIPADWSPARRAQIDRDARWTLKRGRKRPPSEDGTSQRQAVTLAVPMFGYKNHVGIDREHGLIRTWTVTHAAAHDGGQLERLLDADNTAGGVWADTALPLGRQSCTPGAACHGRPPAASQAARPAHAAQHPPGECHARQGAGCGRARFRRPEAAAQARRTDRRAGSGDDQARPRQPHLQPAAHGLARTSDGAA